MDQAKLQRIREQNENAPEWHYVSSSEDSDDDTTGMLTPVSLPRKHSFRTAPLVSNANRIVKPRPCKTSKIPGRRPITRSYGIEYVALDYERKGYVVYRLVWMNIVITFEEYLKYYVCYFLSLIDTVAKQAIGSRSKAGRSAREFPLKELPHHWILHE